MKKAFFFAVLIGFNYLIFELIAWGVYTAKFGQYSRVELQTERVRVLTRLESESTAYTDQNQADNTQRVREILHPYAGYSVEGRKLIEGCNQDEAADPYACYSRVLMPDDQPMPKRSDKTLNVALLGGSVAVGTITGGPFEYYQELLAQLPEYQGRDVRVLTLAAGGYRQPQPLMLLNYYYSLGAEFDLVISLDGFNEIAVASSEYKWNKIHPAFPRSWNARVTNTARPEVIRLQAKKLNLHDQHAARTRFMSKLWPRNSPISNLIWRIIHPNFLNAEAELNSQLAYTDSTENKPRAFLYEELGPEFAFTDWDQLIEESTKIWARSNLAAKGVTEANGGRFFHFIQPNQHVEGAKPEMSDAERRIALPESERGKGYGQWYKLGYPFLQQQHTWLQQQGVNTVDLTYLYKDHPESIYIDSCCHVNTRGSALIIEAIVDTIHQANRADQQSSPAAP